MKENIRVYLDNIFSEAPHTAKAVERKGQLFNELCNDYDDLIRQGNDPQTAFNIVTKKVSDVPALFKGLETEDYTVSISSGDTETALETNVKAKRKHSFWGPPAFLVSLVLIAVTCFKIRIFDNSFNLNHINVINPFNTISTSRSMNLEYDEEFNPEDIDKMKFDFSNTNTDVDITVNSDDKIRVEIYTNYGNDDELLPEVEKDNNKLVISDSKSLYSLFSSFSNLNTQAIISVPESYLADNHKAEISTTSGNVSIEKWKGDFKINTTSGDVTIYGTYGNIDINTTSGNINASDITGDMDFKTASGEQSIYSADGLIKAEAKSGSIMASDCKGGIRAKTTSGSLAYYCSEITDDIDLKSTSGDICITVPENSSFEFDSKTLSGDVYTFFDTDSDDEKIHKEVNGKKHKIEVETTSGNIDIYTNE